jgi:hypothetical protein
MHKIQHCLVAANLLALTFSAPAFASCTTDVTQATSDSKNKSIISAAQQSPASKKVQATSFESIVCALLGRTATGGRQLEENTPPTPKEIQKEAMEAKKNKDLQQTITLFGLKSDGKDSSLLLASLYDEEGYYLLRDIEIEKIKSMK